MSFRNDSSSDEIRGRSEGRGVVPSAVLGVQWSIMMPFGTYRNAIRQGAALAIVPALASAGSIASKKGKPIAVPRPLGWFFCSGAYL